MRILVVLVCCLVFVSSRGQHRSYFNLDHPSTIEGKIRNYIPRENNRFFTLRTFDVSGRPKDTAVQIKPDGSFYIRYTVPYGCDVGMTYSGTYITLLQRIGDRIAFEIDDKLWIANDNKSQAIKSTDEMSRISAMTIDFLYHFSNQQFKTVVDWLDKTKTDEAVANLRLQRMNEELQYFEKYIKEKKISNSLFERWAKNKIIFDTGNEIAFTLFTSSRHKTYTHDQLFTLLKYFPVDSMFSVLNSDYFTFANRFAGGLDISYNINPAYEHLRKQSSNNKIPYILDKIDSTDKTSSTGIWYKLLYYNFYISQRPAQTAFYETRFHGKINDQLLKSNMDLFRANLQKPFVEYDLIRKLKDYDVESSLKERLISLLESLKDKYVYMDFWGTWCGPCMSEMPHYAEFIKRLKDKNISFLFMGVNTPEEEALKVKEKYRIDGNFITLTPSEHAILKNLLSISGYPTQVMLKPGSMVTGYTGENISWGNNFNPGAVKKIESHLTAAQ